MGAKSRLRREQDACPQPLPWPPAWRSAFRAALSEIASSHDCQQPESQSANTSVTTGGTDPRRLAGPRDQRDSRRFRWLNPAGPGMRIAHVRIPLHAWCKEDRTPLGASAGRSSAVCRASRSRRATDSPLGGWLAWAERYTEQADPLSRFRDRGTVLKLYYSGYRHQLEEIRQNGFQEPELRHRQLWRKASAISAIAALNQPS